MDLLYGKEVTMASAGTVPDFLYQKEIEVGERIDLLQTVWQPQTSAQYPASLIQKTKVTEYVLSSDEEICETEDLVEEGTSDLGNQQITQDVDFLVRMTSRFGRQVRVNSRFVL